MKREYPQVRIDDWAPIELIEAVWSGEVEGFVYDDGEVWASMAEASLWVVLQRCRFAAFPQSDS